MNTAFVNIPSSPELLQQLELAKKVKMTRAQRFEQKVSYVFGSLGKNNTLTKDEVRKIVIELEAHGDERMNYG